ncbi:MAG: tryptophan synthase subunit alpha [Phycisphaerales bacterium]
MSATRIEAIFTALRDEGRTGLMPFVTAGYPDLPTTASLLRRFDEVGASICEVGVPFSDPIADGPVIASSMHETLERGFHLDDLFRTIEEVRPLVGLGLVAMTSYSIAHRCGIEAFVTRCAAAGFDGLIFPDLPVDESEEARGLASDAGLTCTLLIAPTTPDARAAEIANACTGFVYLLARTGITGERDDAPEVESRVARLREVTDLPIACGFGVSSVDAVRAVTKSADAAIVGSAIVRRLSELHDASREELVDRIGDFVGELAGGLARRG